MKERKRDRVESGNEVTGVRESSVVLGGGLTANPTAAPTSRQAVRILPRGHYIQTKMRDQHIAKNKIAVYVAKEYVEDFNAILLDAGSTAELIANEMFARSRFLSVLTNNMGAYASYTRALAGARHDASDGHSDLPIDVPGPLHGNELLITGGRYVDTYEALLGGGTIESIKPFTPNVTIIGISGLRWDEGVFCHGEEEAAVKTLLWTKPTDIRLIATDWSKIGKRDAHVFGRLAEFGVHAKKAVIVTCNPPDGISPREREDFEEQINKLKNSRVEIIRLDISEEDKAAP
jgi:DeoR/GlpR family transcriptional regulator of sugar metabolism